MGGNGSEADRSRVAHSLVVAAVEVVLNRRCMYLGFPWLGVESLWTGKRCTVLRMVARVVQFDICWTAKVRRATLIDILVQRIEVGVLH